MRAAGVPRLAINACSRDPGQGILSLEVGYYEPRQDRRGNNSRRVSDKFSVSLGVNVFGEAMRRASSNS